MDHRDRYEGWMDYSPKDGTVRRFDKREYRWVQLDIHDVPDEIVEERLG